MKHVEKATIIAVILIILLSISTASAIFYEENRYNQLQSDHRSLQLDYDEKTEDYNSLQSEHYSLQQSYDSLETSYTSLNSNYNSLNSQYNTLQGNYESLETMYYNYKDSVEIRYGYGRNCMLFITPNDPSVVSATRNVLGHYSDGDLSWDDMRTINTWIGENIEYNRDTYIGDIQQCYLYPSETLEMMRGDCEDHAVLMVSMCKAEADVGWIWCAKVYFDRGRGTECHICVFVAVADDKLYIFETTSGWHSEYAKAEWDALEEYKGIWGASSMTVDRIFSEDNYFEFFDNQDFYDFF